MNTDVTPVRPRSSNEEVLLLAELPGDLSRIVFVLSDLHLGEGRDPDTGTFASMENFLADEAFLRWVEHHSADARNGAMLVLNGDIFDFVRITEYPQTDEDYSLWARSLRRLNRGDQAEDLERPVSRSERWFGLRTHDHKTLWKLQLIIRGHEVFFDALATWVAAGGTLVIVRGNHDVELFWPLIRQAIRDELLQRGAPLEGVEARVGFSDLDLTLANLHIEHGHQYEEMTRVVGGPTLDGDPSQINLPLGSFVNRYLINAIERLNPFIDNIKPVQTALMALLRRQPLRIIKIYLRAWRFVWRAATKRRLNWSVVLILAALVVPLLTVAVITAAFIWPDITAEVTASIPLLERRSVRVGGAVGGLLFPVLLPYLLGAIRELLQQLGLFGSRDHVAEGAREKLAQAFPTSDGPRRVYAVRGHTHVQNVKKLEHSPREAYYVNTGTWIPLWPRERRDLIGRVIYSFARFDLMGGEYRHRVLEWADDAKEPRRARILVSAGG